MTLVQLSGRFDAAPEVLGNYVESLLVQKEDTNLNRIYFTEVASPKFSKELASVARQAGWVWAQPETKGMKRGLEDDVAMMYNPLALRRYWSTYFELDDRKILGQRRNFALGTKFMARDSGKEFFDYGVHMPAGVEGEIWNGNNPRSSIYRHSVRTLNQLTNTQRFNIVGDFNLNMKLTKNRQFWDDTFKDENLRFLFPKRGTLGKRSIDGVITNSLRYVKRMERVGKNYDHLPVLVEI